MERPKRCPHNLDTAHWYMPETGAVAVMGIRDEVYVADGWSRCDGPMPKE